MKRAALWTLVLLVAGAYLFIAALYVGWSGYTWPAALLWPFGRNVNERFKSSASSLIKADTLRKSGDYAIGEMVETDAGVYTKVSDAEATIYGYPVAVEVWTDILGGNYTPTLNFTLGTTLPAFVPLA